ncbi:MAG: GNAT family N-acetyltransferase [Pseudomonadota bacterium]
MHDLRGRARAPFVCPTARGSGVAARLLRDWEARLLSAGVTKTWLGCVVGGDRAARFFEREGWMRAGPCVSVAEVSTGAFKI